MAKGKSARIEDVRKKVHEIFKTHGLRGCLHEPGLPGRDVSRAEN